MRILLIITLLFCSATVMAQQTLISTGPIPLGIQVRDSQTNQLLDISTLCDGFDDENLPINLWIPHKTQIILFLPEITKDKGQFYKVHRSGSPPRTIKNFNFVYGGDSVAFLGTRSHSGGGGDQIIVESPLLKVTPRGADQSILQFKYRVDWPELEVYDIFLMEELQNWLMKGLKTNADETHRTYEEWLDKGYVSKLSPDGLPENPSFPHDIKNLVLSTTHGQGIVGITLYGGKDGPQELQYMSNDENLVNMADLTPGNYMILIENRYKKYGERSISYSFTIKNSFWHQGGYWLAIILPLLIIAFAVYRYLTGRRIQKLDLMQKLSEAELKAIRAQLNPHFLFNALNAIQNLINKQDSEMANDYIVKLSRLLRMVLSQSDDTLHALTQEVEISRLYLELENMRTPFSYDINVASEVNQNMLVPSMILQPYLENAVIHGVVNGKASHIQLSVFYTDNACVLEVSDNGEGSNKGQGNSKGLNLGKERLDIITRQLGKDVKASVLTRKLPEGGFRVTIEIPKDL
ncbi:MAG: histidine kinase [Roseivirga sp.]|nr:histidine kinase [Roseivirga sp.]